MRGKFKVLSLALVMIMVLGIFQPLQALADSSEDSMVAIGSSTDAIGSNMIMSTKTVATDVSDFRCMAGKTYKITFNRIGGFTDDFHMANPYGDNFKVYACHFFIENPITGESRHIDILDDRLRGYSPVSNINLIRYYTFFEDDVSFKYTGTFNVEEVFPVSVSDCEIDWDILTSEIQITDIKFEKLNEYWIDYNDGAKEKYKNSITIQFNKAPREFYNRTIGSHVNNFISFIDINSQENLETRSYAFEINRNTYEFQIFSKAPIDGCNIFIPNDTIFDMYGNALVGGTFYISSSENSMEKIGEFKYSSIDNKDHSASYRYSDNYFSNSAHSYNHDLATMSLGLAMSAFASAETNYENQSKNVKNLLSDIGFYDESISINDWYSQKPTDKSLGVVSAYKNVTLEDGSDCSLIAVAIRGSGYESEWASNVTIGTGQQHEGFDAGKNIALQHLKEYIDELMSASYDAGDPAAFNSNNVKIWITGYSRAAAVANLTAAELCENGIEGLSINPEDIYAYCFETPAGTKAVTNDNYGKYLNIFNIVNTNDPVIRVAPANKPGWGYTRYGITKYLPTPENTKEYDAKLKNMLSKYDSLSGFSKDDYLIDDFMMKKIRFDSKKILAIDDDFGNRLSQSAFLDRFIGNIFDYNIKSPNEYKDSYQSVFRRLMIYAYSDDKSSIKDITDDIMDSLSDNAAMLIYLLSQDKLTIDAIVPVVNTALHKNGIALADSELKDLAQLVIDILTSYTSDVLALIFNSQAIGSGHYPELCLAWMQSLNAQHHYDGRYRIFTANCPVDISIFDSDGALIAEIKNDTPQNVGSSIISTVDDNEQKTFYLPYTDSYTIEVRATDSGNLNLSFNEFDPDKGVITQRMNYYDIPISTGDTITCIVDGGYVVQSSEGVNISPSENYTNGAIPTYQVEVVPKGDGLVLGGGTIKKGDFVKLAAYPQNSRFKGWYEGNNLLSSEAEYRFLVNRDVILTAVFENIGLSGPSISSDDDSSSNADYDSGASSMLSNQSTYWLESAELKALAQSAKENGLQYVRTRRMSSFGIRKNAVEALDRLRYEHDTLVGNAVQVRTSIPEPVKITTDLLMSAYVSGTNVDKTKAFFEKWYSNKLRVISFEQQGTWGQPVTIAAKVDFTGMDTTRLFFYSYDKNANSFKRITAPAYWIDKNGYLRFATEHAGDIVISEGTLVKK